MQARGIFSGEKRGARRGTNGAGRIRLREFHSLRREFVEVRRFVKFAAATTEVRPTQIICENENEIEFRFFSGGGEAAEKKPSTQACLGVAQEDHDAGNQPDSRPT